MTNNAYRAQEFRSRSLVVAQMNRQNRPETEAMWETAGRAPTRFGLGDRSDLESVNFRRFDA